MDWSQNIVWLHIARLSPTEVLSLFSMRTNVNTRTWSFWEAKVVLGHHRWSQVPTNPRDHSHALYKFMFHSLNISMKNFFLLRHLSYTLLLSCIFQLSKQKLVVVLNSKTIIPPLNNTLTPKSQAIKLKNW